MYIYIKTCSTSDMTRASFLEQPIASHRSPYIYTIAGSLSIYIYIYIYLYMYTIAEILVYTSISISIFLHSRS